MMPVRDIAALAGGLEEQSSDASLQQAPDFHSTSFSPLVSRPRLGTRDIG